MILCVTPNPAIDRTMYVDSLTPGEVHRTQKVLMAAGGKGLNVARTIRTLGGEPLCMGPLGGHTGRLLADLAKQEGLSAHWTDSQSETRTCIILVEAGRDATVVNERGAELHADSVQLFCNDVWEMSEQTNFVCISGSLPPGFSLDAFADLLKGLVKRGKSVWVDTSNAELKAALNVRGVNIKVNATELSEALDIKIKNTEQATNASRHLLEQGISSVVVTFGKDGAVLIDNSSVWIAHPPAIKVVSSVGSGDAFLGGLVFALDAGHALDVALRHGVAAGAANALNFGGGKVSIPEFMKIYAELKVSHTLIPSRH